jgi:hypothetical protein
MAVPDSLAAWRDFVARSNIEPERKTLAELQGLDRLDPAARAHYDESRFAWLGADVVLETHDTEALQHQARMITARNAAATATARRGLAISGSSGLGKSTSAMLLGKRHERAMLKKLGVSAGDGVAPVVYTVVPPGTTPKMMMLAFANFLGLMVPSRVTAQELTEKVVAVMRELRTSLVIVDEVHNLQTSCQAGSEAASALKAFSERLDATFIYAGIDLLSSDLFAGDMGRQIKGRMIVHEMGSYGYGSGAQRDSWLELVLGVESLLPLGNHPPGALEGQATYLYDRTGGSIGSLRALLADAAMVAILDGSERINRRLLDSVSTDRAAEEHRASLAVARRPLDEAIKGA